MSTTAPIQAAAAALRRVAGYSLPSELDRRILELGERKESLTDDERAELMAWVAFTQQRSVEKFEAQAALNRLLAAFPELANPTCVSSRRSAAPKSRIAPGTGASIATCRRGGRSRRSQSTTSALEVPAGKTTSATLH